MIVKELVELLKKCNPNDIVMYDAENAIKNGELQDEEKHLSVDDVLVGKGTLKGFIYLSSELEQ